MIGISRALGDHMMKELIINDPHLYATELQAEDKFVILACDGVRLSFRTVASLAQRRRRSGT